MFKIRLHRWLLSFWNLAGVPFTYSYSIIFMATHDPAMYKFPLWGNILLYTTLLTAYYVYVLQASVAVAIIELY